MAPNAKTSEWERAGHKPGGQGAQPPALFPPAFSGESRAPARSRAGNHLAGSNLRWSRKDHQSPQLGGLDKEGHPPRLFASGLSLEKAWIPRPGPGGNPPRRCQPAPVPVGPATDDGDPQGAAPRGTVRATTTQRVRSTLSGSRPESGGKPTLQVWTCAGPNGPPTNDRNRAGPPGSPPLMEKGERSTPL